MDCHASFHLARNDDKFLSRPLCAPHGDDRKKSVNTSGSEVIHIQKFVNFLNNNVALAHCVNNSKKSTQGVCQRRPVGKATVLSKFFTFDNLSRSNPCFVINNFIHKEDIRMKNITKILITILSLTLLFVIGCGDRPTGSTTGGDLPEATGENVTGLESHLQFQGTLKSDNADFTETVNYFFSSIGIENNQIDGNQLKWPDSANKNVVHAGGEGDDGDGGKILMYIKMTFNDITDPQTADVECQIIYSGTKITAKSETPYTRMQEPAGGGAEGGGEIVSGS